MRTETDRNEPDPSGSWLWTQTSHVVTTERNYYYVSNLWPSFPFFLFLPVVLSVSYTCWNTSWSVFWRPLWCAVVRLLLLVTFLKSHLPSDYGKPSNNWNHCVKGSMVFQADHWLQAVSLWGFINLTIRTGVLPATLVAIIDKLCNNFSMFDLFIDLFFYLWYSEPVPYDRISSNM